MRVLELPNISIISEPKNKLTLFTLREQAKTWMLQQSNVASSLHFLEENTATLHFCLLFPHSVPSSLFIKKIDQMMSSGLVQRLRKQENEVHRDTKHDKDEKKLSLSMDHLGICFIVVMSCLGICCVVFVIECLANYLAIWFKKN
jgi:hypothetical protein